MDSQLQSSEIWAALRTPLQSSASISELGSTESANPVFRRIIDGIHFSRSLIFTYLLLLICGLLLATFSHWISRLKRWKRRKGNQKGPGAKGFDSPLERRVTRERNAETGNLRYGDSNSSSSTLLVTSPSPKSKDDELSPLLPQAQRRDTSHPTHTAFSRIKAWNIYQPRNLPIVNKILPSNGTTLLILAFVAVQIFYSIYRVPFSMNYIFIFADRTSLLFVANLPLLYLFAAKNQPIKRLTGYSYETLNIFHRRLGEMMCLLALLHSIGMICVWYTILRPTGFTLTKFLLSKIILLGFGALIAYELIYFTSLGSFRQRWYELFLFLHVSLQVIALILVWFHHRNSRLYVGIALGIFLIDRLIFRMALKIQTIRASMKVMEDGATVTLTSLIPLVGQGSSLKFLPAFNLKSGWRATDHVFLTIPSLSRRHVIQSHPFTIASEAPTRDSTVCELRLLIRARDGFSRDLVRFAKGHDTVVVRLDGPYGSLSADSMLRDCDLTVIVAGGSGIAVAWPLTWSVLRARSFRDSETGMPALFGSRMALIWVVREDSHRSWVDRRQLEILQAEGVDVVLPPPTREMGQPDLKGCITSWVYTHDDNPSKGKGKIGIVCSGPDGMNRLVRNTASSLVSEGRNVDVEIEKFGW